MVHGSFDDRNDARLHVKHWLRSHAAADYTAVNLRRLAQDLATSDTEPVDHVRIAWRERCYGIVKGLVEFAGEELGHAQDGAMSSLRHAHDELTKAGGLLPNRSGAASRHLQDALSLMSSSSSGGRAAERAFSAASLALTMIGGGGIQAAA
jgi:hypothetical protein